MAGLAVDIHAIGHYKEGAPIALQWEQIFKSNQITVQGSSQKVLIKEVVLAVIGVLVFVFGAIYVIAMLLTGDLKGAIISLAIAILGWKLWRAHWL